MGMMVHRHKLRQRAAAQARPVAVEKPTEKWTKQQILNYLTDKGLEAPKSATKKDLLALASE